LTKNQVIRVLTEANIKTIKCIVDVGVDGEQERFIELQNIEDASMLRQELDGMLHFMPEFRTTRGETIYGSQIISLCTGGD